MRTTKKPNPRRAALRGGFSLAELLVVVGIVALLVALLLPPLQIARYQAMRVKCATQLYQQGLALAAAKSEFNFYPLWDDGTDKVRYTWIDVLVQRRMIFDHRLGYCPMDLMPDPLNRARGQATGSDYPGRLSLPGVDYSYGIGVPLSAGGWMWSQGSARPGSTVARRFDDHEKNPGMRVLAGDANWSYIYNLSGEGYFSGTWNDPSWYDNLVAWRHPEFTANLLMQDGHATSLRYVVGAQQPVNTNRTFLWHIGESIHVGPESRNGTNFYPDTPPSEVFPKELMPGYYTARRAWTLIPHK